ncbi:MAG: GAF domain-containing protein [Magnetococcales bacterium]|nr:GAF domain-containing protein [Magnetococcales bacterium]MBF0632123.1 GAF domain-containing protein [Magnetococcales bacterium]
MCDLEKRLAYYEKLQKIIQCALNVALEPLPLERQLDHLLELMLSIPGLALLCKGAVFLKDERSEKLIMVASRGFSETQAQKCATIPLGYCLCGRAASSKKVVFVPHVNDHHDVKYAEMQDHGHYCIPILSGSRLLGVINTYVPAGHRREGVEEDFLVAIASTLAGIIERKKGELALQQAREELDMAVRRQTSKGMFNPYVIQKLVELWRGKDDPSEFVPNPIHVGRILEVVFQASLQRKEEVSIELSVSLIPPEGIDVHDDECNAMSLIFHHSIPFQVDALVALARSFDPVTTTFGVVPSKRDPEELEIYGAIYFNCASHHRFDAHSFNRSPKNMMTVMVRKVGCLQVFKGTDVIGGFDSGFFSEPTPPPFTDSPLAWNLLREVQTHSGYQRFGMGYWHVYRDFIDRLLLATAAKKNGGTIIWLPQSLEECAWHGAEPRFSLAEAPDGAQLLETFREMEAWSEFNRDAEAWHQQEMVRLRLKRELMGFADLLSRLTRVDGAMFLSDRLSPLTFGAMITAKPWKGGIVSWVEERMFPSVRMDLSRLGARHTSAVNFIGHCPGAVAFVISQDGPVAGLVQKDMDTIYWWPDCLGGLRDS